MTLGVFRRQGAERVGRGRHHFMIERWQYWFRGASVITLDRG